MPKRNRLLASVAMPLLSMSLLVPDVHAAMPTIANPQVESNSNIVRVQDQAPGLPGQAEEELKQRRPKGAPEGEGGKRPEPEQREPKKERPPEPEMKPQREPEAPRPPKAEAAPEMRPAEPAPKREPQPEPEQVKPRPAPKAEAPVEPKPEPEAAPKPAPKREAPAAEEPAARKAPAEQPAEAPAPKPAPKAAEPAPKAEAPVEPKPEPKPVPPKPAEAAPPAAERPAKERPAGERPRPQNGEAAPVRPGTPPVPPAPGAEAAPGTPQPAPGTPPAPPVPGAEPQQRSDAPAVAPAAPGTQPVVAAPKTPEEIQRAKKIADNPASATGPVVLPVENGAAVLDSAKEAPAAVAPVQAGQPGAPRDRRSLQRSGAAPVEGQAVQPALAPTAPPPPPPTSDAAAQAAPDGQRAPTIRIENFAGQRGERLNERPRFEDPRGWQDVRRADDNRTIIQIDNRTFVRHDDSERFIDDGYRPEYERLPGGRTREIYQRDNGIQIVTVRNRYGEVIQRSRVDRGGREYVLFYAPELADERDDRDYQWRDPGDELPPMRLTIPVNQYIIDTTSDPDRDYYRFLEQPPVERVERVYSVDEVRYSARIRDKVRRIDLDTITFATGSADIPMNQASSLRKVADAIKKVLDRDPAETFLIEGHTDAVGSAESNLVLSDRRAESVARVLTDAFGIPPENMVTQGYGETYLKVKTDGPEQQNRRVTIRRITALVKPVAQNQ